MRILQRLTISLALCFLVANTCLAESVICDVTNSTINEGDGYLATTTEILGSKYYWKNLKIASVPGMDMDENQLLKEYAGTMNMQAGKTPWILSENAARNLNLNDEKHRNWAIKWWKSGKTFTPPGNGRIDIQKAFQAIENRNK